MHSGPGLGQFDPIIFLAKHHTLSTPMAHTTILAGLMMTITACSRFNGFPPDKAGKNATSSCKEIVESVIDMNERANLR